jgi:serine/threonine-protein kinase
MNVEGELQPDAPQIGPYRILQRLSSCGEREAFLATDAAERHVVLKVLGAPPSVDGPLDPRITDEASSYARLSHPNLVRIVDLFSASGRLLIALETIEGTTLNVLRASLVRSLHKRDDACWIYVASCVFAGLAAAHAAVDALGKAAPILHGNVNPSIVHVAWDGTIKLGDFGVASIVEAARDSNPGLGWGSYGYLAPEQASARPVGPQADVYSAMLVLWELLAGRKAVERLGDSATDLLDRMAQPDFHSLDELRPDIDQRVRDVVRAGLEPDPSKRTVDAAQVCDLLRSVTDLEAARLRFALTLADLQSEKVAGSRRPPPVPRPRKPARKPPLPVRPAVVELVLDAEAESEPEPRLEPESQSMLPTSHSAPEIAALVKVRRAHSESMGRVAMFAAPVLVAGLAIGLSLPRLSANAARREQAPVPTAASTAQTPPAPEPGGTAAAQEPATSASAPAPEPAAEPPPAKPAAEEAPAADPIPFDVGELQMPASAAGHRIFVDGRTASEGTDPVRVHCGAHEIRIGSAGRLQQIDVPCGSSLAMTR